MRTSQVRELLFSVGLGFCIAYSASFLFLHSSTSSSSPANHVRSQRQSDDSISASRSPASRNLLFVGVMTAQKYLSSRADSVFRTWGQNIPGRIAFFSSAGSTSPNLPVVALPGVDDAYPPQKKSFLMLKYMSDHFLDDYEWFMRADDDVYVRTDRLETFLRSLNSSRLLFIGQAGMGNKDEFGMLSLAPGENFCMGGPGIIMSRETLRLVAPHIKYCLKHLYSTHEDVEIGRCINKFVGIPCAWSYEMQTIFHHNQSGAAAFTGDLHSKEVHRAITLHPVKTSEHLYRIQNYYDSLRLSTLRHESALLERDIRSMQHLLDPQKSTKPISTSPGLNRFHPSVAEEMLEWEYFTKTSSFSFRDNNPKRAPKTSLKWAVNDLTMQMMDMINLYSRQRGRIIDFKDLLYGFQRIDPLHGVHYVLDLHLVYKRYAGKKTTVPVRRHAYLEQSFTDLTIAEEVICRGAAPQILELDRDFGDTLRYYTSNSSSVLPLHDCSPADHKEKINFILPLSGRQAVFARFLRIFESVCLANGEFVSLHVMHFSDGDTLISTVLDDLKSKYFSTEIRLHELDGNFSRAVALQTGAALFQPTDLLFFVDVDMTFDAGFLSRIRRNTRIGRMVYYPIVFNQYQQSRNFSEPVDVHQEVGYWRQFGFGIVSLFKQDLDSVGGFDVNIRGWGKEDVELFDKFIQRMQTDRQFEVFRSADPGIDHVYHPVVCDPSLESSQMTMCIGTKAAGQHAESYFVQKLLDNAHLLHARWPNSS